MSPRLKLRAAAAPLVIAGALWGGSELPAAGPNLSQTPPPCSPDGVCLPRPQTFGWYQTRWRTFPGDLAGKAPTRAEEQRPEQDELRGPVLPEPTEEGQVGPARTAPGAAGAGGAEEPAAETPSDIPLPGIQTPPAGTAPAGEGAAPAGPATAPAGEAAPGTTTPAPGLEGLPPLPGGPQPGPGAEPGGTESDPLSPFGSAPPTPPAWLQRVTAPAASNRTTPAPNGVPSAGPHLMAPPTASAPLPMVDRAVAAVPAVMLGAPPVQRATFVDAPNLQGDDAPPSLPASLHGGMPTGPAVTQPAKGLQLQQPPSVQATPIDSQVKPASAEQPVGIQLINPASAQVEAPIEGGLQQAIYFEASDQ